jgi:23S rRNA (uracil1939-C5)-methyltransferase
VNTGRHLTLATTGVAAGGDALARDEDGRVVFVAGALPGERVVAEVGEEKRDFLRAAAIEVLEPSPRRAVPPCLHFLEGCGGCDMQHADLTGQREVKRAIVVDALRRIGHLADPPVLEAVHGVPADGYRTTVRAAVDKDGVPGLHRRSGHDHVAIPGCVISHPLVQQVLAEGRFPGAKEVLIRASVATGQVVCVPAPRVGAKATVPTGVKVIPAHALAHRTGAVTEVVHGRRFRVSARSFFQSGPLAAEVLVDAVDRALGHDLDEGGLLVDAYAGVGVIGGVLATRHAGVRLELIESGRAAVQDALHNLRGFDAEVLEGHVSDWTTEEEPVAIVADPARSGLGPDATAAIAAAGAPTVVLVSCDPASLARDARLLLTRGYDLERVRVLDLFPHTSHVEAVARFTRRAARDGAPAT